jgi:hypothetical protein
MKYLLMSSERSRDRGIFGYGPDCNNDSTSVSAIRGTMFDKSVQFPPAFVSIEKWCIIL